jgi:phenylalanyl-tRNA synthetase beta chain
VGKDYGSILGNSPKVPLILDANQQTVSFPPIINAAVTTVTTKTKNLFVEVTGINKVDVEDMLSVVATILQSAGFTLESVQISGAKNSSPKFEQKKISVNSSLINQTLGLNLNTSKIVSSLKKSRIDASTKGKNIICIIPAYRFDIFGPMDLVEEVALGYGIQNLEPTLSPSQTLGQKHPISINLQSISSIMTGLGYMEALNSSLTSKRILYDNTKRDSSKILSVLDSKSLEHTILRDSLLPGLIDTLAKNIHESYPQKLFEVGTIFNKTSSVTEETHLCATSSHKDANFSEMKSVLQSVIQLIFGKTCETKTTTHPTFEKGHVANITVDEKIIGIIGEISKSTKDNFKLRESIVSFEIKLPG